MTKATKTMLFALRIAFVFSMICFCMMQIGCGNHTMMGLAKDSVEFNNKMYNHYQEKHDRKKHGIHTQYWRARVSEFFGD